jgi:uncharacterized membrane protein
MYSKEEIKNAIRKAQVSNEQETEEIINRVQIEVQEDIAARKRRLYIKILIGFIILSVIIYASDLLTDLLSLLYLIQ